MGVRNPSASQPCASEGRTGLLRLPGRGMTRNWFFQTKID